MRRGADEFAELLIAACAKHRQRVRGHERCGGNGASLVRCLALCGMRLPALGATTFRQPTPRHCQRVRGHERCGGKGARLASCLTICGMQLPALGATTFRQPTPKHWQRVRGHERCAGEGTRLARCLTICGMQLLALGAPPIGSPRRSSGSASVGMGGAEGGNGASAVMRRTPARALPALSA